MIVTVTDLIDALGGNQTVAAMLGVQHNTVSTWRERGLPGWACSRLRDAADAAALRYECALFEIRARSKLAPSPPTPIDPDPERTEAAV